jgi:hypothetical protein
MRTFKLKGQGPLFGLVAYATVRHMDPVSDDGVVLELDESQRLPNGREFWIVTVSANSGAVKISSTESDLIAVDPFDMPRLQEAHGDWMTTLEERIKYAPAT